MNRDKTSVFVSERAWAGEGMEVVQRHLSLSLVISFKLSTYDSSRELLAEKKLTRQKRP